jgi:hypothetical protein
VCNILRAIGGERRAGNQAGIVGGEKYDAAIAPGYINTEMVQAVPNVTELLTRSLTRLTRPAISECTQAVAAKTAHRQGAREAAGRGGDVGMKLN